MNIAELCQNCVSGWGPLESGLTSGASITHNFPPWIYPWIIVKFVNEFKLIHISLGHLVIIQYHIISYHTIYIHTLYTYIYISIHIIYIYAHYVWVTNTWPRTCQPRRADVPKTMERGQTQAPTRWKSVSLPRNNREDHGFLRKLFDFSETPISICSYLFFFSENCAIFGMNQ